MPCVLIVEREGAAREQTSMLLERAGYHVIHAADGRAAQRILVRQTPDLMLLDTQLPGPNGFEICRRVRRFSDVPLILLSSLPTTEDLVRGLNLGADDFIGRPFTATELLVRAQALLRRCERARRPPSDEVLCGSWRLDPRRLNCRLGEDAPIELTPRELHLLSFLMRHSGRVCTTGQIAQHVWGFAGNQARSIVATFVWRLRLKLEGDTRMPRHILTVRNVGYTFQP
ncbi:MAG TPA: response regulator transcription factor [Roseiflexaceae bacterium]|nr:response regulator transcription factor [Roseiflexaceae bacterium]HMP42936.1 response regulator transcription factor [Roseiflexaceae bacterium]